MNPFRFEIVHRSSKSRARVGKIYTPHGIIHTPSFVAVGTNATLKALDSATLDDLGLDLLFCNTYHLMLQPGEAVVQKAGGLHSFMNRKKPIITDSGGFQVFSLAYGGVTSELKSSGKKSSESHILKIDEEGVVFRSYRDGSKIFLSPETSVEAQKKLGADIIIPFDELPPYHIDPAELKKSFDRTHRWEQRSLEYHLKNRQNQAMYGVIHGGIDRQLREESIRTLSRLEFDGYAIGGSVGKTKAELYSLIDNLMPLIPGEAPVHLLGIGDLPSIDQTILHGIDTFDSSFPTKAARHGLFFKRGDSIRIKNQAHTNDFSPIDPNCPCHTCKNYSRAYLQHLFKSSELSFYTLATIHNIAFMVSYMADYRNAILKDEI